MLKQTVMKFSGFFLSLALIAISFQGIQAKQMDDFRFASVVYQGQLDGISYYLTQDGISFTSNGLRDESMGSNGIHFTWLNANSDALIYVVDNQGFQYLLSEGLRPGASMEKVIYENIYFNIDLVIHQEIKKGSKALKYEFIVYPGGNPNDIAVGTGSSDQEILQDGSIIINQNGNNVIASAPKATQENGFGEPVEIRSGFNVENGEMTFSTEKYEQAQVLTISYDQEIWIP